jgi:hypothetical protein
LNSTTGTITNLRSTTGTITNLSTTLAGDFTISQGTGTLATSGATSGTYGSVTAIPFITVNAKGIITAATTGTFSAIPADGSITPAKLSQPFTSATAVASTSGTAIDFTAIPSWVKRITVMLNEVSLSSTSHILIQLGISSGIDNASYKSQSSIVNTGVATVNSTSGFVVYTGSGAVAASGSMAISSMTGNLWASSGVYAYLGGVASSIVSGGVKQLSGVLDRIRITSTGADTFDSGSINIMYEG